MIYGGNKQTNKQTKPRNAKKLYLDEVALTLPMHLLVAELDNRHDDDAEASKQEKRREREQRERREKEKKTEEEEIWTERKR